MEVSGDVESEDVAVDTERREGVEGYWEVPVMMFFWLCDAQCEAVWIAAWDRRLALVLSCSGRGIPDFIRQRYHRVRHSAAGVAGDVCDSCLRNAWRAVPTLSQVKP